MDENAVWYRKTLIENAGKKLQKNGYTVFTFENGSLAAEKILEIIKPGESVGFGGSQTVKELNLIELLEKRGQKVVYNKYKVAPEESLKIRKQASVSDVYVASPNAVTRDGKLMFMDKIGNRACGMVFGPEKIIAVAGFNKIVTDEESGWERINTVACPMNAKRLGIKVACGITGECVQCDSAERMCNIAVTLWKKPANADYYVILVAEELGY